MIKTQIQVPEKQYQALRKFATEREWSMAETFRRGAELLLEMYPCVTVQKDKVWEPPTSGIVGWKGLEADALKELLHNEAEPVFPENR
jgi:hypothetical protein